VAALAKQNQNNQNKAEGPPAQNMILPESNYFITSLFSFFS